MAGVQVDGARLDDSGNLMSSGTITEAASLQPIWARKQTHGKTRSDTRHPRRHLRLYFFATGHDHWLGISPTREHIRPAEIPGSEPCATLSNNRVYPFSRLLVSSARATHTMGHGNRWPCRECVRLGAAVRLVGHHHPTTARARPVILQAGSSRPPPLARTLPDSKKWQASRPDRVLTPYPESTEGHRWTA